MSRFIAIACAAAAVCACGNAKDPVAPPISAATEAALDGSTSGIVYTGRGTAVDATIDGANTRLCDTGALPRSGGRVESNMKAAAIAGVLTATKLYCITTSAPSGVPRAISEGTAWDLDLTLAGNRITADWVHSMAGARCPPDAAPFSTGSAFARNLRVNGRVITIRNGPNQKFELPNGYLIFNQQNSFGSPWHAGRTVVGLRIVINRGSSVADVLVGRSQTHIDCP